MLRVVLGVLAVGLFVAFFMLLGTLSPSAEAVTISPVGCELYGRVASGDLLSDPAGVETYAP